MVAVVRKGIHNFMLTTSRFLKKIPLSRWILISIKFKPYRILLFKKLKMPEPGWINRQEKKNRGYNSNQ
jgi:hypothetical protein